MTERELLTTKQAAELLRVTDARIRQLLIEGTLRGEKFGSQWMIRRQDVERYRQRRRDAD